MYKPNFNLSCYDNIIISIRESQATRAQAQASKPPASVSLPRRSSWFVNIKVIKVVSKMGEDLPINSASSSAIIDTNSTNNIKKDLYDLIFRNSLNEDDSNSKYYETRLTQILYSYRKNELQWHNNTGVFLEVSN